MIMQAILHHSLKISLSCEQRCRASRACSADIMFDRNIHEIISQEHLNSSAFYQLKWKTDK